MKSSFTKELPSLGFVALPFLYLLFIWNELPEKVPLHWNLKGEIDRFGSKAELILIPILLPLLIYVIFLIIPKIDPKNKLNQMGNKLDNLKLISTVIMSVMALYILYASKMQSFGNLTVLFLANGLLVFVLGNYFKTIKPNYFIGIRTPWTLESEEVWKSTHILGGKLWFAAGILFIISSLVFDIKTNVYICISILSIIIFIPIIFSYVQFNNSK